MGLFDWLLGKKQEKQDIGETKRIYFPFVIYEDGEQIDANRWYQKESWKNKRFVSYKGTWGSDWKWSDEGKVKVAGISKGNRAEDFLNLAPMDGFKMFLENDPENPVNKNARKVMASAVIKGKTMTKHIGYLPDVVANKYAGIELDIRPASAFLPPSAGLSPGVEVALLVRSAKYLKKKKIGKAGSANSV